MARDTATVASIVMMAIGVAGCARGGGQVAARECAAREAGLAADVDVDGLAGEYRFILVATKGDSSGHKVAGRLSLHRQKGAARRMTTLGGQPDPNVTVPLYGATDIDLNMVGAVRLGDLGSEDPMSPGVMVLDSRAASARQIVMRLGYLANRRGDLLFDGGYAALQVGWVARDGFGGTWASGVRGPESAGYFCAFRSSGS